MEMVEPDAETQGAWHAIGAWIYDYCAAARVGLALSDDLAAALGLHAPDEEEPDEEPDDETDPMRRAPRELWHPGPDDVEADRAAHRREVMAALEMVRALIGEDEWARRRARIPEDIREGGVYAPLVLTGGEELLSDDDSATRVPAGYSEETIRAAYARYESMLRGEERGGDERTPARDNVIDLFGAAASAREPAGEAAAAESPRWLRRVGAWVAGAVATAVAALVVVVFSAHPPPAPAQASPLPLSAADYPTCPTAITDPSAAPPDGTAEPTAAPPAASPAAAPAPAAPPRRKVSKVKLTEIRGVRVRREGHADVVISTREATQADDQLYVIDLDEQPDTAVTLPMRPDDAVWMVLE